MKYNKVRKHKSGTFRVYSVWSRKTDQEVRFGKKVDAEQYILREGGYLGWTDFMTEPRARLHLSEKAGKIYW